MLNGTVQLKGDKSISHRILIFAAMSNKNCRIQNLSNCTDVKRTINILKSCGVKIYNTGNTTIVNNSDPLRANKKKFYCGNSGSTARFMLGFLPTRGINGVLYGDRSLSKRPMNRIIKPLQKMNANLYSKSGTLPINFKASTVSRINHTLSVPSAQVKTSLIFAALTSREKSIIKDPFNTRDHTERLIEFLGYRGDDYTQFNIKKFNYTVPGDISSAAFLIAAALLLPQSNITIKNVLFNVTRIGFISSLISMGANISTTNKHLLQNESVCDINIKYTKKLKAITINRKKAIAMIDEIPIFSLICAYAVGKSEIRGIEELRYKESDRINSIIYNFKNMNIDIKEKNDGFDITGPNRLYSTSFKNFSDHRFALLGEVINLIHNKPVSTKAETRSLIKTSFPEFYDILGALYE